MRRLTALLSIIWLHPFIKCPICHGQGGAMEGYYEPEWTECECWPGWQDLEDRGLGWFIGKVTPLNWCRVKAASRILKTKSIIPLRETLRCYLGIHRWAGEEVEPGRKICMTCFEAEKAQQESQ